MRTFYQGEKIPLDAIPSMTWSKQKSIRLLLKRLANLRRIFGYILYRLISIRLCLSISDQAIKTNSLNVERA